MQTVLAYINWNVSPEIVSIGPITLRWYGLLFATGFLTGLYIVRKMFEEEKAPEEWLDKAFIYIVLGTVLGARLGHVFFYDWDYYSNNLSEIPMVWKGGLASHGGAIAIIISLWLFSKYVSKKSILWILDKVVVPTALAACFIRLGNLMNSEILVILLMFPGHLFLKKQSVTLFLAIPFNYMNLLLTFLALDYYTILIGIPKSVIN